MQQRDAVFETANCCMVMKGCFCHGRGLFMSWWDEKDPICLMVGCCLCSDTTALAMEEIAECRQDLRNPNCQVTLFFFSFFSLRHRERQPNLLFQLHFLHFMLFCIMFNKLLTSGVTAVLGHETLFPLQLRPPSLPFYLHNNTTPCVHPSVQQLSLMKPQSLYVLPSPLVLSFCHLHNGQTMPYCQQLVLSFQELNLEITAMYMTRQMKTPRKRFLFCLCWYGRIQFRRLDPAKFCNPVLYRLGN